MAFRSPEGQRVLADLATFCRAAEPTYSPDARLHALLEGRREVWLRIQNHLQLSPDELYALLTDGGGTPARTIETSEDMP